MGYFPTLLLRFEASISQTEATWLLGVYKLFCSDSFGCGNGLFLGLEIFCIFDTLHIWCRDYVCYCTPRTAFPMVIPHGRFRITRARANQPGPDGWRQSIIGISSSFLPSPTKSTVTLLRPPRRDRYCFVWGRLYAKYPSCDIPSFYE